MELSVVLVEMGVGVGRQGWALGDPDPLAVGTSCLRAFNNKDGKNAQVSSHSLRLVPSLARAVLPRGEHVACLQTCRGIATAEGFPPGIWGRGQGCREVLLHRTLLPARSHTALKGYVV